MTPRDTVRIIVLTLASLALSFCDGGGGGGDSSGGNGSNSRYGLRVLHGALEGTPVEFTEPEDSTALVQVRFLGDSFYSSAPEGPFLLSLFTANSGGSDLLVNRPLVIAPESRQTVLLFGDQTDLGLRASTFTDLSSAPSGGAILRFLNGVDGSGAINVTVTGVADTTQVAFGGGSSYLTVPLGSLSFSATRVADGLPLASGTIVTEDENSYTVVVSGEAGVFVSSKVYSDS